MFRLMEHQRVNSNDKVFESFSLLAILCPYKLLNRSYERAKILSIVRSHKVLILIKGSTLNIHVVSMIYGAQIESAFLTKIKIL